MFERNSGIETSLHRTGISLSSVGNLLSHSAEIFVHGPFYVSKNFWHPKSLRMKETREITNLVRRVDVSQYRKLSQANPSVFQKKSRVSKNFTHKKGISFFCAHNFLSHGFQKFRRWTRLSSKYFGYRKLLWIKEEGCVSRFSVLVFVSQYGKISVGNLSVFQKKSGIEKTYG